MTLIETLYQDVILEHARRPRHLGLPQKANRKITLRNQTCGDHFTVAVVLDNEKIIDIGFIGTGCAIATAAASLMAEMTITSSTTEALELAQATHLHLTANGELPHLRLAPFSGVRDHPNRHGCALLSWRALEALLAEPTTTVVQKKLALEERIIAALKTVFDPEVPVNIYDLGFIYKLTVTEDGKVTILMTLTTPHCPVAESLPREVERRIATVDGVSTVSVALTFTPPWTKEKMSNDARLALGI